MDGTRGANAVKKVAAAVLAALFALMPVSAFAAVSFELGISAKEVLRGGTITMSGTTPAETGEVTVKIVSPARTVFYIDEIAVNEGRYETSVTIPADADLAPYGAYEVIAGFGGAVDSGTFSVVRTIGDGGGGNPDPEEPPTGTPDPEPTPGIPIPANPDAIPQSAGTAAGSVVKPQLAADGRYLVGQSAMDEAIRQSDGEVTIELPEGAIRSGDALELPGPSVKALKDKNLELVLNAGAVSIRYSVGALAGSDDASSRVRFVLNATLTSEANQTIGRSIQADPAYKPTGVVLSVVIQYVAGGSVTDIGNLDKPAYVTIRLTPEQASAIAADLAGVYYVNGGLPEYIKGSLKDGVFTFKADHFSLYAILEYDKSFADLSAHWAETAVKSLAAKHIVTGVDATRYEPARSITRGEFATMLMRAVGWQDETAVPADAANPFRDVASGKYYAEQVAQAASLGIVEGYDGLFRPDDEITREEAVVALARAAGHFDLAESGAGKADFADGDRISSWAAASVDEARSLGLIQGDGERFYPKNPVTRAEVAMMIHRLLPNVTN